MFQEKPNHLPWALLLKLRKMVEVLLTLSAAGDLDSMWLKPNTDLGRI